MKRARRFLIGGLLGAGFAFYLLLLCGVLLGMSMPMGMPGVCLLLLIYGWVIYAFVQYREGRQQELTHLLCTIAEAQAPLAPALWAYLDDRPRGTLREFWTAILLFFLLPGYYWIWHRRHTFERKIARVAQHLEMGETLADALDQSPGVVARGTILAVRIGEKTGRLAESLRSALPRRLTALWLEMLPRFLYPMLLVGFMIGLTSFWMTNVLPKMERIYGDFDLELPEATQRLTNFGAFVLEHLGILFLLMLISGGLAVLIFSSSYVLWYVPILGRLYRRHQQSNVLKLLSTLLRVDMPAPASVEMLAKSSYFSRVVRRRLQVVATHLQQGEPLALTLQRDGLLPKSMTALVQASERMHNLPWALNELGESMGERTVRTLRRMSQVAAPLLVIGVGFLVALEVLGIFMPVIEIVTRLSE
jgi:general secretion pathway protein F